MTVNNEAEIQAVYHSGMLELEDALPFNEGQTVRVIVRPDNGRRLSEIRKAMDEWKAGQSGGVSARPADELPAWGDAEEWARLDAEFDELLAEVHSWTASVSEEEIAADVEEAVRAAQARIR